jgi:cyclomaltodextrinase / maltogenic alpha-amylase / neopullulanase
MKFRNSRYRFAASALLSLMAIAMTPHLHASETANQYDLARAGEFENRERDWRNGAVVYQVLVDRFAPSANLDAKRGLYPAPKTLNAWTVEPKRGIYRDDVKVWSHEIDFWGGDLASTRSKLSYVQQLGADVLYLNPIVLAYTNHKYDALDYQKISPEYGTREDVKALAADLHQRGMKLVLDGVFNHMGRNAPMFQAALKDANSPYRDWFYISSDYAGGARGWFQVQNLPELNLENPKVRDYIFAKPDSVIQSYLDDGVDGWRLDVAFDIGFNHLDALTQAAHARKPGSLIVGEIANYPKEWFPSVDAVMNFTMREVLLKGANGSIEPAQVTRMMERIVSDAGIEPMLKSWIFLDNHDTPRLHTRIPDATQRRLAQVLQFTVPGAPNLYYGTELGMQGNEDPEMRAPMRWDWVNDSNAELAWTKQLIALRKNHRALRIGDFRRVEAHQLIAFERYTDRVADTIVVLANPGKTIVRETVLVGNSKLMNGALMLNALDTNKPAAQALKQSDSTIRIAAGLLEVELAAGQVLVLKPDVAELLNNGADKGEAKRGYSPYKRVQ